MRSVRCVVYRSYLCIRYFQCAVHRSKPRRIFRVCTAISLSSSRCVAHLRQGSGNSACSCVTCCTRYDKSVWRCTSGSPAADVGCESGGTSPVLGSPRCPPRQHHEVYHERKRGKKSSRSDSRHGPVRPIEEFGVELVKKVLGQRADLSRHGASDRQLAHEI